MRISSQFYTSLMMTFGFCPGAGRIFSGKLAIPSKSLQLVRSMRAAKMYGKYGVILLHLWSNSMMVCKECSRLNSLASAKFLSNSLFAIIIISSKLLEGRSSVLTILKKSVMACLRTAVYFSFIAFKFLRIWLNRSYVGDAIRGDALQVTTISSRFKWF